MTEQHAILAELTTLRRDFPGWAFACVPVAKMYQFWAIEEDVVYDPDRNYGWPEESSWCGDPGEAAKELAGKLAGRVRK